MHSSWSIGFWLGAVAAAQSLNLPRQNGGNPNDPDPGADALGCKDMSFTGPSFYIYDPRWNQYNFADGGTTGMVGFEIYNIATNESYTCIQTNINLSLTGDAAPWYNCSVPNAQFMFDVQGGYLGVKEKWVCKDAPSLTFEAIGHSELPIQLGCGEDINRLCLYANVQIRATLKTPVDITPLEAWPPTIPYEYGQYCGSRSSYPGWQVDDLFYDHTVSPPIFSFNMTNIANGKVTACSFKYDEKLIESTAHAQHWVDCGTQTAPADANSIAVWGTKVMFDADYKLLGINQTWRCHDGLPPTDNWWIPEDTFDGLGWQVMPLQCTTPADNSDKYTCTMPSTNLTGYVPYELPPGIPHTSYVHSCTENSINSTGLILKAYELESSQETQRKNATFTILNPGPGDEYQLSIAVSDDGAWHKCEAGAKTLPWQLVSCEYMLDTKANKVGFKFQWYCDDLDPLHALIFDTTASGSIPKQNCQTTTRNNLPLTTCLLPAGTNDINLGISNVTWKATQQPMDRGPTLPWV